ncbi:hypothetical protein A3D00_01895 [Candidatus Woesebacteria bacterium RIFCSPHIGHO2_02_FULL_38_9]|uniref:Membrane protein 6-pyruvoyl-tetrahydropterin synthase-related domain-containing protein n=1 Tax=Candidatus Woesebacteria bacterium RIFCSPHIGHO2_01_FULL_39_28 TaxID=1802496 RepID=A0A1F7YI54_9BACT|nr:MAG: hypothetical protein A2627_02455 [Candidatus Woesebacteria bacterium RIFCSPHIGHO2_01_FULL_39_28]OGM32203.1 MAG: hypothetical protein A3D00_01895 [Candidatus Woesebacteria bacterium RIFCSPHIGHO2_02_FULL_38_9]OGM57189.1 MAG: hypothetical protein A3A50_03315 [Candidatus Woesebacteria bacterium RIFCSPLOWO2_01_FULL_38_20]
MKAYAKPAFLLFLHFLAIALIFTFFYPIADWYFNHRPILGVDFYNTVTYAKYFKNNFDFFIWGFKYFWYGGYPSFSDFFYLWFYIVGFVAKIFPLIDSTKITMLGSFLGLLVSVYLVSYILSKNQFFSALISILVALSGNMYGSLIWGGSLPYFANQLFFPLVLFFIAYYLETQNRRFYWLGVLAFGVSLLGHLLNSAFILPSALVLLLLGTRKVSISFREKIKDVVLFFVVGYFIAYRSTRGLFQTMISTFISNLSQKNLEIFSRPGATSITFNGGESDSTAQAIINFEKSRFYTLFTGTNVWLLILFGMILAFFLLGFLLDKNKKKVFGVLPWILIVFYSIFHVYLNSRGISFLPHAWYRAFWHFPIAIGLASSALIGYSKEAVGRLSKNIGRVFMVGFGVIGFGGILFLGLNKEIEKSINLIENTSSPASAHPEAINLVQNQSSLDKLKAKLVPNWIDPNDKRYRLFTSDAQVNVWWNSLFDMPLARGYQDPPIGTANAGDHFLLDQSIGGNDLVNNFKYDENVAKNMALYYIDWYSIAYYEGGHLSKSANKGPSSYLLDQIDKTEEVSVNGAYILYETKSGKPEIHPEVSQYLTYHRFNKDLVTPILSGTDSPVVLCACSWPAYETLTKNLSMNNINSRYLITIFWPDSLDSLSETDLSNFDLVILNSYKYGNQSKAFDKILGYVEKGGKVIIETGSDVAEAQATSLPEVFPFSSSKRGGLGKQWKIEVQNDPIFDNIDIGKFSPPIFNKDEWKFSYPAGDKVQVGVDVLLKNQGKPLIIRKKQGKGIIFWSGMNLTYHIQSYTNLEESKFFMNILSSLVPLNSSNYTEGQNVLIKPNSAGFLLNKPVKGVVFREEFYDGWKIKLNGVATKVYKAGPAYPGFIYVPVNKNSGQVKVEFKYWGSFSSYLITFFSLTVTLMVLERIVFNRISGRLKRKVASWWEKEDEQSK